MSFEQSIATWSYQVEQGYHYLNRKKIGGGGDKTETSPSDYFYFCNNQVE